MTGTTSILMFGLFLFLAMLVSGEFGRRLALRRAAKEGDEAWEGMGAVDGAILGLMGLVIAFTFSGAVTRFDVRRTLIVQETNAIGTAYLRLDLLPMESQPPLRDSFRRYLDSRIAVYKLLPDIDAARAELANSQVLQREIWDRAIAAARGVQPATMLITPALNQMFDITTTRTMAALFHPPTIIFVMLFGLATIGSLVAGYSMAKAHARSWLRLIGFAAVTSFTVYVILDIEYPRLGFIRVDAFDQALVDLRASMN